MAGVLNVSKWVRRQRVAELLPWGVLTDHGCGIRLVSYGVRCGGTKMARFHAKPRRHTKRGLLPFRRRLLGKWMCEAQQHRL